MIIKNLRNLSWSSTEAVDTNDFDDVKIGKEIKSLAVRGRIPDDIEALRKLAKILMSNYGWYLSVSGSDDCYCIVEPE